METKVCTKCKEEKGVGEFGADLRLKSGLSSWCKKCKGRGEKSRRLKNPEKYKERARERYRKNPQKVIDRSKEWRKVSRFNLALISSRADAKKCGHTPCTSSVREISDAFTGKCYISGSKECLVSGNRLVMDHNHITGDFRGWISGHINLAIGLLNEDVELMEKIIAYLKENKAKANE